MRERLTSLRLISPDSHLQGSVSSILSLAHNEDGAANSNRGAAVRDDGVSFALLAAIQVELTKVNAMSLGTFYQEDF